MMMEFQNFSRDKSGVAKMVRIRQEGTGNLKNRNFFIAYSVAAFGHPGSVGQLIECFYHTLFENDLLLKTFAPLLNVTQSQLKTMCRKSAQIDASDVLFNEKRMLAFPIMLERLFQHARLEFPQVVLLAEDAFAQTHLQAFVGPEGQRAYHRQDISVITDLSTPAQFAVTPGTGSQGTNVAYLLVTAHGFRAMRPVDPPSQHVG